MKDAPLLALTRHIGSASDAIANDNMWQLIQLRWLAVAGQFMTIMAVRFGLGVPLPVGVMLGVVALLAAVNLASSGMLRRRITNLEFLLALLFDVMALTAQLYLSGGAENPFIALYLVQVVLGAILLRAGLVWILVAVTAGCFALLT